MQFETVTLPEFFVAGIETRTTNKEGQSQRDIGALWQKYFAENISSQISDKLSADIYCIYTGYESDASGAYTTVLGHRVDASTSLPEGLVRIRIPASTYFLYRSTGKLPDVVVATWMQIWQSTINRKFTADFDVYLTETQDPDMAEVETYVAIRDAVG